MEKRILNELNILKKIIVKTVPVVKIYLIDSSKGDLFEDSDCGLYVVIADNSSLRELEAIQLIHKAIRDQKTIALDVIVAKKKKFDQLKFTPGLEQKLWREGQVLYE